MSDWGPTPRPSRSWISRCVIPRWAPVRSWSRRAGRWATLVRSWHAHECVPSIPPDEDELLHARRIVAQRCLYGVDKNPMAVDLAKLSLWLATLAKDHPFTFLDHALRCGDSLVGLSTAQIVGFHWKPERQRDFVANVIGKRIERATESRREIREAPENAPESLLSQKLALADEASIRSGCTVTS